MASCAALAGMLFHAIKGNGSNLDDLLDSAIIKTKHVIIAAARPTALRINEIMPVAIYIQSQGFLFFGGKISSGHF